MQEFSNQEEHLQFLRKQLAIEREFVKTYYGISKTQIKLMYSKLYNKPVENCKISLLNYEDICNYFDMLRVLIYGAKQGTGCRIPKSYTNPRQYAKDLRLKQKEVNSNE